LVPRTAIEYVPDGVALPAAGAAPPFPVRLIVCGLPVALSTTDNDPLRAPVAVGVNRIEIWQLAPELRPVPQLFVCA
jgi:hypothetical protein